MKLPSTLRRLLPTRIWHQIFLILSFLVVIPLLILCLLLLQTSQKALRTTVLRDYKEIAVHTTGEIKEYIEGTRQSFFVTAAILGTLSADPWRQETTIIELSLRNPAFDRISSVDMLGQEIVTSALGTDLRDLSNEKSFQLARFEKSYLSEVKISESHIPFVTIAEPVRQLGQVKGVLMADLNLRTVWEMIDHIQVGKMGKAYLIDQMGRIIAHPDKKLVLKNVDLNDSRIIQDVLLGRSGTIDEVDSRGERWLTAYAPVEGLNWGLVISQPEIEAFAYSNLMRMQFLFLLVLSVIATITTSFLLAHYMSRPIKNLIQGTHRIAQGDFSHSFPIKSRTEINKLLFSFNRMTNKLKQAQEMQKLSIIGKAAAAIAHELKNSLQLVNAFVKVLPERHTDKEFIKEFSDTIPKELESWNTSLKNMMSYSAISEYSLNEIDINKLIKDITLLIKLKAMQMDILFEVNFGLPSLLILGNEEKLKQVFLNLFTNALEATPCGGNISISTRLDEECALDSSSYVEIKVSNTGEGIVAENSEKIFEPFYTTKNSGLGLGLSICKEIIHQHKGNISVVQDEATSFIIRIPAAQMSLKKSILNQPKFNAP